MKRLILLGSRVVAATTTRDHQERLGVYHSQTAPLIDWYKQEGIHHHICRSRRGSDRIFGDICDVIDNL
jgi:adenylate kinase